MPKGVERVKNKKTETVIVTTIAVPAGNHFLGISYNTPISL